MPAAYVLPIATSSAPGGIKVGAGLAITVDGTLSATGASSSGVVSFNGRSGVVALTGADVTAALQYSAYSADNPAGYQTAAQVASAVGAATSSRPSIPINASGANQTLATATKGDISYIVTLNANCAFALSGGSAGFDQEIKLYLNQDSVGGHTPSMPPGVIWNNDGVQPTFNTAANAKATVWFNTPDNGATWYGRF